MTKTVEIPKLNKKQKTLVQRIKSKVEATHWTKFNYETETDEGKPQYCLVGFVNHSLGVDPDVMSDLDQLWDKKVGDYLPLDHTKVKDRRRILDALFAAIKTHKPRTQAICIENFNDSRATKREDILAVLDLVLEA